jgi:hypothetical protein
MVFGLGIRSGICIIGSGGASGSGLGQNEIIFLITHEVIKHADDMTNENKRFCGVNIYNMSLKLIIVIYFTT